MEDNKINLIIYAPNIHTGGGLVLLSEFLNSQPNHVRIFAFLDIRSHESLAHFCHKFEFIYWVKPSLFSRIKTEIQLKKCADPKKIVFCFHNIPPVLCRPNNTIIFIQNRLILEPSLQGIVGFRRKLILIFERLALRLFYSKKYRYIVQTPSMRHLLNEWIGSKFTLHESALPALDILPFTLQNFPKERASSQEKLGLKKWDFIYPSSGDVHKNHLTLLEAWINLSEEGIFPSLCLTIDTSNKKLLDRLSKSIKTYGLDITNLGNLQHGELLHYYHDSKSLIFPSMIESFGLPLIEAASFGLPILAPELDYVRDVCDPVQTFDPKSFKSIANAVKRHLKIPNSSIKLLSPNEFWNAIAPKNMTLPHVK